MTTVSGVGATNGQAVTRQTLANNFETFLTLLTTQLRHQNPLEPLDTNQFTQQLVQFAGVEQQPGAEGQVDRRVFEQLQCHDRLSCASSILPGRCRLYADLWQTPRALMVAGSPYRACKHVVLQGLAPPPHSRTQPNRSGPLGRGAPSPADSRRPG